MKQALESEARVIVECNSRVMIMIMDLVVDNGHMQRIRVKGQTYPREQSWSFSCAKLCPAEQSNNLSSLVDRDPLNSDSNVFPNPDDSVTDIRMNPVIVTNDPDVRQRTASKSQSKSRESIVLFLACTEVSSQRLT